MTLATLVRFTIIYYIMQFYKLIFFTFQSLEIIRTKYLIIIQLLLSQLLCTKKKYENLKKLQFMYKFRVKPKSIDEKNNNTDKY